MTGGEDLILWREEPGRPLTVQERLTRAFYFWEARGRGWAIWPYPVALEPPFRPFFFSRLPPPSSFDDGRKPTLLSSLVDRFIGGKQNISYRDPWMDSGDDDEVTEEYPAPARADGRIIELQVAMPPEADVGREAAEQFILSLSSCARPVGLEIIGRADAVTVQMACHERDAGSVFQQLAAYFPDALVSAEEGILQGLWDASGDDQLIVEFGLSREFMLPLRAVKGFAPDPLIAVTGALSSLTPGEVGVMQVLFEPVRKPWAENILRSVTGPDGQPFFADAPELARLARHKIARPLFACVIRASARSRHRQRSLQIIRALGGALAQFASPDGNELIALSNDGYEDADHELDLLGRQTHRCGLILNAEELATVAHLPSSSVRSPKLIRQAKKTKAAPQVATGHSLALGENRHGGLIREGALSAEQRTKHIYVIAASGTGKSTLLLNLIRQDVLQGRGLAVLDPHGDLIDRVLEFIPDSRTDDVVLFDPSDEDYPIGFNILSAHSALERTLLESDLVAVFRRLSTSWGDQMNSVLGNAILAFLESDRGGTLADLRRFLVETEFRHEFLKTVRDHDVVYYWLKEFPLLTGRPQAPLLTRLDTFLRPRPVRYMVGQKENRVDFAAVMNEGKILLAKLSQGAIGEENSWLLGSLLVSKFHQAALSRQELAQAERRGFDLYIDELQNFVTPSMAAILSGARKYRLGLVLAHQELRQLAARDAEVTSAVLTNPYTRICFRVGDDDARKLAEGFAFFDACDLQNLSTGEAVCRVERADFDFNLHTQPMTEVDEELADEYRQRVRESSRQKYGRPRAEVEAEMSAGQARLVIPPPPPPRRQAPPKAAEEPPAPPSESGPVIPVVPVLSDPPGRKPEGPPEVRTPAREKARKPVTEPPQPGRGGQQHKYLQQLIRHWGEERGFRATVEKQVAGGSVDVALESNSQRIACEIRVTTTVELEVGNIRKCLSAGFEQVVVITAEKKTLARIREAAVTELSESDIARVQFFLPEDFFLFLEQAAAQNQGREEVIKGYKVKVRYKALSPEEQQSRREAIARTV